MTHEFSLMADLLRKVSDLATELRAHKVVAVTVKVGALVPLSREVLREHFALAARGTIAEGARLSIGLSPLLDPTSQSIVLEEIEVEEIEDRGGSSQDH